jgi:toxin YoeB
MKLVTFEASAFDALQFWARSDLKILKKIIELLNAIDKNPFEGIGKPEPLKGDF